MLRSRLILTGMLLALGAVGCDRKTTATPPAAQQTHPVPSPPAHIEHPATLSGRIVFGGLAPRLPRLPTDIDPHCQKLHPDGLPDESVVIAADGAVGNVFVYLKDAPRFDGSARPPALIDQIGCQYVPHAVAVQINQPLRVKSSDMVFHNIHILAINNPAMNLAQAQPGEQTVVFATAEMIPMRCDVHPWMKALVGVFDNPWFAVTGRDGKFTIRDVPPGDYTLAAWHERFGELTRKITVGPDGLAQADFTYSP